MAIGDDFAAPRSLMIRKCIAATIIDDISMRVSFSIFLSFTRISPISLHFAMLRRILLYMQRMHAQVKARFGIWQAHSPLSYREFLSMRQKCRDFRWVSAFEYDYDYGLLPPIIFRLLDTARHIYLAPQP